MNKLEYDRLKDRIELCGKNRGSHQYIPIAWAITERTEYVTMMMCTVCFTRVNITTLQDHYPEARI